MKALITGASSGIGSEFAKYLSNLGYDLILVARRKDRLNKLLETLKTNVEIISLDLSKEENCYKLYEKTKNNKIDILINNAGFGKFGQFDETDLNDELEMIDLNIKALHILTKLYIKDMIKRDSGYILNVASMAAFAPGPLMATYYSSKSYVLRLTESIKSELEHRKSNVSISALCPGPVDTEFNDVANVSFSYKALTAKFVAQYGINKLLKKKTIIIPGTFMKLSHFFSRFTSEKIQAKIIYNNQKKKQRR